MSFFAEPMNTSDAQRRALLRQVRLLPSPLVQLDGMRASVAPQPDNIVCFCRHSATDLNRPQRGRALHHRCVLIVALETTVTVCIDDRAVPLHAGEAILVLPFQFHDYVNPEREELNWLFITFDLADVSDLETLRFRPFELSPALESLARSLVEAYLMPNGQDLAVHVFRHMLARIKLADPIERGNRIAHGPSALIAHVNQVVQKAAQAPCAKEIASAIGISESHLRARFRESCGVSLGKHLRRLRLEKACGLLRLSTSRISEISEQCGFTSVFSFSRAFHLAYGVSPRDYRRGGGRPGGAA